MVRLKTRFSGIEVAFALLTVAVVGFLREEGKGTLPEKATAILAGIDSSKNVSMGAWIDLGCRLAALVPEASTDPIARAARALVAVKGNKASELAMLARAAVAKRNDIIHENVTEATCAAEEAEAHTLGRRIETAFAPLGECEMVSLVTISKADFKTGTSTCRVRILQGAKSLFDIQPREIQGSLEEPWCYLLREGKAPLSLAPVVLCMAAETGGHDVFLVRSLGAQVGTKVEIAGMLGGGKKKIPLPG
jgi:hypothetical protein